MCAQVHEIPQSHCDDNREGTLFLQFHILRLSCLSCFFETRALCVSWITHIYLMHLSMKFLVSSWETIDNYLEILVKLWCHQHDNSKITEKATILTLKNCDILTIFQKTKNYFDNSMIKHRIFIAQNPVAENFEYHLAFHIFERMVLF